MPLQRTDGACALLLASILGVGGLASIGAGAYFDVEAKTHKDIAESESSKLQSFPQDKGEDAACDRHCSMETEASLADFYSEKSQSDIRCGLDMLLGAAGFSLIGLFGRPRAVKSVRSPR